MASLPHLRALAGVLLLSLPATAQALLLASNDNDTHNTSAAIGWPSSTVAMKFTAPVTGQIGAAQVFTGNAVGTNGLAIWSHDAVANRPSVPMGPAATWSMARERCFQGTTFANPIGITGGQSYWLVWDVVNFAQSSVAGNATPPNVEVETSSDGGVSWQGPFQWAAQFRLYEPAPTGTITPYGTARPGLFGNPTIGISGWPTVGNPLDIWLDNTVRRAPAFLLVGLPTQLTTPLGTLLVDATEVQILQTGFLNFGSVILMGSIATTYRVPASPLAIGLPLSFQWAVIDPFASGGLAHTTGITALLQ